MKVSKKLVMKFKTLRDKSVSVNGEDLSSLLDVNIIETCTTNYDLMMF